MFVLTLTPIRFMKAANDNVSQALSRWVAGLFPGDDGRSSGYEWELQRRLLERLRPGAVGGQFSELHRHWVPFLLPRITTTDP